MRLHRPNTMNNHGAILDDFGFGPMMDAIMRQCVQPLARLAGYADVVGGEGRLRTHHAFIVSYELGKDTDFTSKGAPPPSHPQPLTRPLLGLGHLPSLSTCHAGLCWGTSRA